MNKKDRKKIEQRILENRYEYEEILAFEGEERANGFRNTSQNMTSHIYGISVDDLKKIEDEMKDVQIKVKISRR